MGTALVFVGCSNNKSDDPVVPKTLTVHSYLNGTSAPAWMAFQPAPGEPWKDVTAMQGTVNASKNEYTYSLTSTDPQGKYGLAWVETVAGVPTMRIRQDTVTETPEVSAGTSTVTFSNCCS